MNSEVSKYWNEALKYFNDAKVAFERGDSDSAIKKELYMSVCNGHFMNRELKTEGEESLISC